MDHASFSSYLPVVGGSPFVMGVKYNLVDGDFYDFLR